MPISIGSIVAVFPKTPPGVWGACDPVTWAYIGKIAEPFTLQHVAFGPGDGAVAGRTYAVGRLVAIAGDATGGAEPRAEWPSLDGDAAPAPWLLAIEGRIIVGQDAAAKPLASTAGNHQPHAKRAKSRR